MVQTSLSSSMEIFNVVAFVAASFGGQLLNAVSRWANGEVHCIMDWMRTNPRRTVAAFIANIMAVGGALIGLGIETMTFTQVIVLGATMGFSADSAINKGKRTVWNDDKREAVQEARK